MEAKLGVWTSYYMELDVKDAVKRLITNGMFNLEIPGERGISLEMRDAKLAYIKVGYDYLMKD